MNLNTIIGIVCIVSLSAPAAVIIYHQFYKNRSLAALLIYLSFTLTYLLMSLNLIAVSKNIRINFGILDNYLDVPLMLWALVYFCPGRQKQNTLRLVSYVFIGYEVLITLILGFKTASIVYIMGPGLVIIISYSFYFFSKQVKFTTMYNKNYGRMLVLAAVFFLYSCYALVYYFFYIRRTSQVKDTELIYFMATIISSVVMAIGLHLMNRRIKELRSLKITRKELAMFFDQ